MTRSPPHRITLILVTALAILTLNMFLPSLANIARDLETSYAVVSLAVAGYLGITAVVHLVIGPLSDRYGRRPVLLSVLVLFIAASIICSLAENIWMFLLFRMLQAGMASGSALSMVIVRDTHSKREAAGVIGYISMAMALAPMLGPILGGTLDAAFGWRSVFHFYALAGFCMFVLCWLDVGETRPERAHNADGNGDTFWTVAREPRFWAYALCTAFSTGAFYIFIAGAPLVADTTFKVSTAQLGLFIGSITGGFMLGSFFAGRYSPHHPLATMMIAGRLFAFGGLILGLTLVLSGWLSPLLFFGCTIFCRVWKRDHHAQQQFGRHVGQCNIGRHGCRAQWCLQRHLRCAADPADRVCADTGQCAGVAHGADADGGCGQPACRPVGPTV